MDAEVESTRLPPPEVKGLDDPLSSGQLMSALPSCVGVVRQVIATENLVPRLLEPEILLDQLGRERIPDHLEVSIVLRVDAGRSTISHRRLHLVAHHKVRRNSLTVTSLQQLWVRRELRRRQSEDCLLYTSPS